MEHTIEQSRDDHFAGLMEAYRNVGDRTWSGEDFSEKNIEESRNLFTAESLVERKPVPKQLEVYALLAGVSFPEDFTEKLVSVQQRITEILGRCLHYWVAPQNLGVEYCVFKWPTDSWNEGWRIHIQDVLESVCSNPFRFHIRGVQINPDGCVVARGFDENAGLFSVREKLKAEISFLPDKQSGWAHVPLGRILEPPGPEKFAQLDRLMSKMSDLAIATTKINSMKFIHETRWYMEERSLLSEYQLVSHSTGVVR